MHKTPNALNIICHLKLQSAEKQATHHSVGLISVPTGRFAFATEHISAVAQKTFATLQGLGPTDVFARKRSANAASAATMLVTKALSQDVMVLDFVPLFADPQGIAQPQLQSTYILLFNNCHP
ncbi:hypothetical protein [Lysinibacillus xylanilyticus]|uniref:hypothetical protein n=1 Tax=Lysinibacillus xylanilyticus TaxID=582475 RepID=UPI00381A8A91